MVILIAVIMLTVVIMLWLQSSCYNTGTDMGKSRFARDHDNDNLAKTALTQSDQYGNECLLEYVRILRKNGYHTASLTYLKFGAERGAAVIMKEYAAALAPTDPAAAEKWLKRAGEIEHGNSGTTP